MIGLVALAASVVACGTSEPRHELVLTAPDGGQRVVMSAVDDGAELTMLDGAEQERVQIATTQGAPHVTLLDASGTPRARVGLLEDQPTIELVGTGSTPAKVFLGAQDDGGMVSICDAVEERCVQVFANDDRRGLLSSDDALRMELVQSSEGGGLEVSAGEARAGLEVSRGRPSIEVESARGRSSIDPGGAEHADDDDTIRVRLDGARGSVETAPSGAILRPLD